MKIEQLCWERGCACYDDRFDTAVEVHHKSNLLALLITTLSLGISLITFAAVFLLCGALRMTEPYAFMTAMFWSLAPLVVGVWDGSMFNTITKEKT
jgi:hypothetical protein